MHPIEQLLIVFVHYCELVLEITNLDDEHCDGDEVYGQQYVINHGLSYLHDGESLVVDHMLLTYHKIESSSYV